MRKIYIRSKEKKKEKKRKKRKEKKNEKNKKFDLVPQAKQEGVTARVLLLPLLLLRIPSTIMISFPRVTTKNNRESRGALIKVRRPQINIPSCQSGSRSKNFERFFGVFYISIEGDSW